MINSKLNHVLYYSQVGDIRHTIARYIKKHMKEIPAMSIAEVANECHVSKSMMSKFSRELGYENYIELKDDCIDFIEKNKNESVEIDYVDYFRNNNELFEDLSAYIDYEQFESLIDEILKCNCLYLYGNAHTYPILVKLQYELDKFYIPCSIIDEDLKQHYEFKDSSLFLVFNMFDSDHINKITKKLSYLKGCRIWEITPNKECPYHHLYFPQYEETTMINFFFVFIDLFSMVIQNKVHKM